MDKAGKLRIIGVSVSVAAVAVFAAFLALLFSSVGSGQESPGACPLQGGIGSFALRGNVLNSSFHNATSNASMWGANVNVSIFNMTFSNFGEPQKIYINSTNTSSINGSFFLNIGPGSCSAMYTLSFVAYNASGLNAWEVGPSLPPLPVVALVSFMDNSTFYLQPAATLNLTAVNQTHNISFNYVIFDDALGFPLAENFMTRLLNASVVVPRAKNYTVMMMRSPQFEPGVENPFATALPPQTIRVQNASNFSGTEFVISLTKNLSFGMFTVSGNVSVVGNTTPVNVTQVLVKLGMAGMVPPNSDVQIPGGTVINQTSGGGQHVANYSVTVMGASDGIYQLLEFYGANASAPASGSTGEYFAYFSNFTVAGDMVHNVTLKRLAGNYTAVTGFTNLNASFVAMNLSDASGTPLQDAHAEIKVDMVGHKSVFPTFRYMADQLSGGLIRLPMLNDSNATLLVFNRQFAPLKFKINVTNASKEPNGIIQVRLNAFKPKKFQADGSAEDFTGSSEASFRLTFLRNSDACNVFNVSVEGCRLFQDDFGAGKFNPLKVMASGKVNILSEINTTGVKVYFIGVDMMASGPPEASMSDSALRKDVNGSSFQELFKFGSVAPNIYDMVVIGLPYNYSRIDDSNPINFTIKELFDDAGALVWNSSQNQNAQSIPDAWSDYNASFFNVSSGGMPCLKDSDSSNLTNTTCFVNTTTNYIWVKLPHFSDGAGGPSGSDTTPPAAPANVNFSATPGGNVVVNWTDVPGETGESYIVLRSAYNLSSLWANLTNYSGINYVINITNLTSAARIGEGVQAYTDNATMNGSVLYYAVAAVDASGNLQNATPAGGINLSGRFNTINVTVNDTVIPRVPANITVTASDTTVTIGWLNVTQDVLLGADFFNLTYYIYRSEANHTANLSGVNITVSNVSSFVKSVSGFGANSTTVTGLVRGTYHFAVVTADDGGNVNLSVLTPGNYANVSVTPDTVAPNSGGNNNNGGGGGGGGGQNTNEGVKVSKKWDILPSGAATMAISKAEIGFSAIDFTVANSAAGAEITVTKLDKPPVVKRDVQGRVYQYIRIDKVNIPEAGVSNVTVEFKVEKKWFDQNSGSVKNIVLQRYFSELWTSLDTAYVRSDDTHQYFVAKSPGLSIFAIVLKAPAEAVVDKKPPAPVVNLSGDGDGNVSDKNETSGKENDNGLGIKVSGKAILVSVGALAVAGAVAGAFVLVRKKGRGSFGIPNPFSRFRRRVSERSSRSRSEEEEAAEIVKDYEAQRQPKRPEPGQKDQRGRPPEAFN